MSSGSQEIPSILWNLTIYYHIHKSRSPVSILSHINPIHALYLTSLGSILILSSNLRLDLPRCLFTSVFPTITLSLHASNTCKIPRPLFQHIFINYFIGAYKWGCRGLQYWGQGFENLPVHGYLCLACCSVYSN